MNTNVYIWTGHDLSMKYIKVNREFGQTRVTFAYHNGDVDTKLSSVSVSDAVDMFATVYRDKMTSVVETCD